MGVKKILPGHSHQLGAYWDGDGTNFALYSSTAQHVELCLFDSGNQTEIARHELPMLSDDVWHGYLPGVKPGDLYGYRVHGDYDPGNGLWFNPNKLLIDPYARRLTGTVALTDLHFAYADARDPFNGHADTRDNAQMMPKCVVTESSQIDHAHSFSGFGAQHELIYEAHVKGLSRQHPDVEQHQRGTYKALTHPAIIEHLERLCVSCIELLPVHSFASEIRLKDKGLSNYWGYNTVNFFCPHLDYAAAPDSAIEEFQHMAQGLHSRGIQLILDVVYNHSAEGDHLGPILSFKGIDNKTYYMLTHENTYINHSGCGNTLNLSNRHVLELVMSSLRYWVQVMGADGFRFDLASVLGRDEHDRFNKNTAFFQTLDQDPVLKNVKLIAEPWDIGSHGHQTGQFPAPWSQWNDFYRDGIRRFWRGDGGELAGFADHFLGSSKKFEHTSRGRRSWASLNFVTSHDGYTLNDLVSFENKHNQANAENNRDGHNHNISCNHGTEGKTDDATIIRARDQHRRNLMATLLLSQGVPMLLAGDEFANSQNGNNNAYCQDNPIAWLDWFNLPNCQEFLEFTQYVANIRRSNNMLRHECYIHADDQAEKIISPQVLWLKADGSLMDNEDWHDPSLKSVALFLSAKDRPNVSYRGAQSLLLIFNHGREQQNFNLDELEPGKIWRSLIDTRYESVCQMQSKLGASVDVAANSMILAIVVEEKN